MTGRRSEAGSALLSAIALVQAHRADDASAYSSLAANTDSTRLVSGLVDLVQLLARVAEPDTGQSVDELLERAFSAEAARE